MSLNIYDVTNDQLNKVGLEHIEKEKPWAPLQNGYSNFWFELTDGTLSPWLNFSAKTENAVIDWGDGSGEVALDTLTPTHTYSKAGKYVVKCKGVTGIAAQYTAPYNEYNYSLIAIELNSDITTMASSGFAYASYLKHADLSASALRVIDSSTFFFCGNLTTVKLPSTVQYIYGSSFRFCTSLKEINTEDTAVISLGISSLQYNNMLNEITLPSTLTSIETSVLSSSASLTVIHIQSTSPPTLGTAAFAALPSDFIIYVPVGTGDTYKAASGWSTYSDHILEEGQQPTRAMLSKFGSVGPGEEDEKPENNER